MAGHPRGSRHLGLDLGGTNIKWVVIEGDGATWRTLDRGQLATEAADGPDAVVARLITIGQSARGTHVGIESAGVGIPGLYDPAAGTTRFLPNLPGEWDGMPVADRLAAALDVPVHLINDARAFGLAELRLGAAKGAASMIGLTIGTGIGGVIALERQIYHGRDGTAGELGHQTIDPDGPPCTCGNRGCLEAFARADQVARACGAPSADEAVDRARSGEAQALDGMNRIGRYLGIGIANMVAAVTPERIVLGGGLAAAGDLLTEPIRAELRRRVHTTSLDGVEVVTAELGTWAGSIGAAIHGAEVMGRARVAAAAGSA